MVTENQYRRAVQITNKDLIDPIGAGEYIVTNPATRRQHIVFSYRDGAGRTRWASTDNYFRKTGRESSYIAAVKLLNGQEVKIGN